MISYSPDPEYPDKPFILTIGEKVTRMSANAAINITTTGAAAVCRMLVDTKPAKKPRAPRKPRAKSTTKNCKYCGAWPSVPHGTNCPNGRS